MKNATLLIALAVMLFTASSAMAGKKKMCRRLSPVLQPVGA